MPVGMLVQWTLAGVLAVGLPACVVAAAGAGAGSAIHFSGHTAEAIVEQPLPNMESAAERVLRAEEIEISESRSEDKGAKRTYEGKKGDLDVTVTIEREGEAGSKVRVTARRSLVSWDDEYAKQLLAKIIA